MGKTEDAIQLMKTNITSFTAHILKGSVQSSLVINLVFLPEAAASRRKKLLENQRKHSLCCYFYDTCHTVLGNNAD